MRADDIRNTMNYIEEITRDLGDKLNPDSYYIEDLGCPHKQPHQLPKGYAAIYIFVYEDGDQYEYLKVGKANTNSEARFTSQHYGFSTRSTLAKSLCKDERFKALGITEKNAKKWMLNNLHRINIYIRADCGKAMTELVESVLHYRFRPRYEGNI